MSIAIVGLVGLGANATPNGAQIPSVGTEICESLENGRSVADALANVPATDRGADWWYFSALDGLVRGDPRSALEAARRSAAQGSARGWAVAAWLEVSGGEEPADPPAGVVAAWRENRHFRALRAALRWSVDQRGHTFPELPGVTRIQHYGAWPGSLRHVTREAKSQDGSEAATLARRWLSDSRGLLIGRLSGGERPDVPDRDVLISYFDDQRARVDVPAARRAVEAVARLLGDRAPILLWVVHSKDPTMGERVRRGLDGLKVPLFVAHTSVTEVLIQSHCTLVGGHTWIRSDRKLHAFIPPGIPLACALNGLVAE